MANKRIDFEVERGRLASRAMMRFKDIFLQLGVINTEVKDGLRSYKFNDFLPSLNEEDFEKALQGVGEREIDGLYEAYTEMREGEFDALYEPGDFSAADKAKGHDRTYNKNADETIREQVSLTEVLSSFVEFFDTGRTAQKLQTMEQSTMGPVVEKVNLETIRRVRSEMEGKTSGPEVNERSEEPKAKGEPESSQSSESEMDNVKKSLEMHEFEVERGARVKMKMIRNKDFFMQLGMLEKETKNGITNYVVTDRVPTPEEIQSALAGLDEKSVESIYQSYAEIIQGGTDALWNKNDFTQDEKNNGFDLDYNVDAVDRIRESMSIEDILRDMSDFYSTSQNSKTLRDMDRKLLEDMARDSRPKTAEVEEIGVEREQ